MDKKGLTLFEIIISTLIMSVVLVGLANIFTAGKRHILHSRSRATGGELGKLFLDPLQMQVRQDTWDNASENVLATGIRYCDSDGSHTQQPGTFCPSETERTIDNIAYSAKYDISNHPSSSNIRKVILTLTWNENSP